MKSDFISKLAIKSEASNSKTSLSNEKESFIVYSLFVNGLSYLPQNLPSLLVGIPIVDKIWQNDGIPSPRDLWTFFSSSEISP